MYFGYERMWTLTFVPVGFVVVTIASVALGLVYVVGAARGGRAASMYTRACAWGFVVAIVAVLAFGVLSGQLALFLDRYGATPLIEMGLLAFMWVATMWLMAVSYSRGRMSEEAKEAAGSEVAASVVRETTAVVNDAHAAATED